MLTKFKEKVQNILTKEAEVAYRMGLTPNVISGISVVMALVSALLYMKANTERHCLLFATFFLVSSGFCDVLDGALARLYHKTTIFGGFLDSLLDRYSDAAIFVGIILGGLCDVALGTVALIGSLLVSYSRARAEAAGIKMTAIGVAERAERMIILTIASIMAFFWQIEAINVGITILAILSNVTVLQRGAYVYKKTRRD